jgi:hypothetical protein
MQPALKKSQPGVEQTDKDICADYSFDQQTQKINVTTRLTLDLLDNCVKQARVQEHAARVFPVLEQINNDNSIAQPLLHHPCSCKPCDAHH